MKNLLLIFAIALAPLWSFGQGKLLWDESIHGPLGVTDATATPLGLLQYGTNTIIGASENTPSESSWIAYPDNFFFQVPVGSQVSALYLSVTGPNVRAWIGNESFTVQYGWARNSENGDLLGQWGMQPLQSLGYGMYMANTDRQPFTSVAQYRLDIVLTPIPEPATWALLALGGGLFWLLRHTRRA
jgi:hypothetical protein